MNMVDKVMVKVLVPTSPHIYIYTLEVQRQYFDRLKQRNFPFRSPKDHSFYSL